MGIAFGGMSAEEASSDTGGEFKLMPAGEPMEMDIIDCVERVSNNSGKDMFELTLQPVVPEFSNRKVWDYIVDGEWFDKKMANVLASAGKDFTKGGNIEAVHLIGLRVTVKLKHEPYNGKMQEKVGFYEKKVAPITPEPAAETVKGEDCPF
jgi:hypothetical protein